MLVHPKMNIRDIASNLFDAVVNDSQKLNIIGRSPMCGLFLFPFIVCANFNQHADIRN